MSEMPARIAALDQDHRGYPVPFIVYREADGRPLFAVNEISKTLAAVQAGLCHVCGQELDAAMWFVGAPGSVLLNGDRAVFRDGPMHRECLVFSMETCPHLSQQMSGPVALAPIKRRLKGEGRVAVDPTVIPGVAPVFIAVLARKVELSFEHGGVIFGVLKPFAKTEYWRAGGVIDRREGEKIAKRHARELAKELGR